MVFNDTSNDTGIVQRTAFYLGGGVSVSSTGDYTLKQLASNASERMRMVWSMIFTSKSGWKWDDSNQTNLPQGSTDLVSGTGRIRLPSSAHTIERISIYDSAGNQSDLKILAQDEVPIAVDEWLKTGGIPQYAFLVNGIVELKPAPNYNYTNGIKFYFSRDIVDFVSSDTTKTPGFASVYHDIIPVGCALDYAESHPVGMEERIITLTNKWNKLSADLQDYYSNRLPAKGQPKLQPIIRSSR